MDSSENVIQIQYCSGSGYLNYCKFLEEQVEEEAPDLKVDFDLIKDPSITENLEVTLINRT